MQSSKQVKTTPKSKGNVQESFVPYFECEPTTKNLKRELWTTEENYRYVMFLREKSQWFASETLRRQKRVFAEASKIVGTKTCKQIKSHHQKLLIKLKTIEKIIDSVFKPVQMTDTSFKCVQQSKEMSEMENPRDECSILALGEFENSNQLFKVLEPSFLFAPHHYYDQQLYQFSKDSELINQFENDI